MSDKMEGVSMWNVQRYGMDTVRALSVNQCENFGKQVATLQALIGHAWPSDARLSYEDSLH